jgi:hypothetical protein
VLPERAPDADELGGDHPHPRRLEGERHHGGALAPLRRHRHDAEDREQDAHRGVHALQEVQELRVQVLPEDDRDLDDQHEQGQGRDRDQQPAPGPGVSELAQLDTDESSERDDLGA